MGQEKSYLGKIVRVEYPAANGVLQSKTGVVLHQEKEFMPSNFPRLELLLPNGNTWSTHDSCKARDSYGHSVSTVSSVIESTISKEIDKALKECFAAKSEQEKFLDYFWKHKAELENKVYTSMVGLRRVTGDFSIEDFMKVSERMFNERFADSYETGTQSAYCSSISSDAVSFTLCREVSRYQENQTPFVYREPSGSLVVVEDAAGYDAYADAMAPKAIPELKNKALIRVEISTGQKGRVLAERTYTFALCHGISQESLNEFAQTIGYRKEKDSIAGQLQDAAARAGAAAALEDKTIPFSR